MATVQDKIEFRAHARWVRTAPRKAQLVVEEIRGRTVPEAQVILAFMTRAAAKDVAGVLNSAVANAESHPLSYYSADDLYVAAAEVGTGPTLKRWRARARGRVGRIKKRTCHITIRLEPVEGAVAIPPPERPRRESASPRSGRAAAAAEGRQAAEEPRAEGPASPRSGRAAAAAEGRQAAEEPRAEGPHVEAEPEPEAAVVEEPAVDIEAEPEALEAVEEPPVEPEAAAEEAPAEAPAEEPRAEGPKPARSRKKKTDEPVALRSPLTVRTWVRASGWKAAEPTQLRITAPSTSQ